MDSGVATSEPLPPIPARPPIESPQREALRRWLSYEQCYKHSDTFGRSLSDPTVLAQVASVDWLSGVPLPTLRIVHGCHSGLHRVLWRRRGLARGHARPRQPCDAGLAAERLVRSARTRDDHRIGVNGR